MIQTHYQRARQEQEPQDEYDVEVRGSIRSSRTQSRRETPRDENFEVQ